MSKQTGIANFDGRPVQVKGSDYAYEGRLCVAFRKSTGAVRFIVEDQNRRLFVHNADQTGLHDLAGDRVLIPLTPEQQAEWADQMRGHSEDPRWLDLPRAYGPYGDEHPEARIAVNYREPGEFGDGITVIVAADALRTPFIRSTCSGIAFDLANPTPEMIEPADIAWHLSMINRWGGNLTMPYNVAHHSVLVGRAMAVPQWRIYGLLHDAGEAYITDLITPLKAMIGQGGFDVATAEQRIVDAVLKRFDLPPMTPEIAAAVHEADQLLLATEYRDVVRSQIPSWMPPATPLPDRIEPLDSDASYALFLSELDAHMREVA